MRTRGQHSYPGCHAPAVAVAWEIWTRNRIAFLCVLAIISVGALLILTLNRATGWTHLVNPIAYSLTAVALAITLGSFHYTEGSRKAGFGSFPTRLFNLPMNTWALVALPMVYGSLAMILVFLACARFLLWRAGPDLPLLWPSLYLVFGLTSFQAIIWSLPGSRYLKLLGLGVAASIITFGWMFFAPTILAGALSEWGYSGDPAIFMRRVLLVLAMTGPAAYIVSLRCVHRQRHGRTPRLATLIGRRGISLARLVRRRIPFQCAEHAIFWQEWRRIGVIFPASVLLVLLLTCVPALLSGGLSGRATVGILEWLFFAPFLLAAIIGRGFGKPDFWSTSLKLTTFNAVLPLTPGQWVCAKLKVAFLSAVLTWALLVYLGFLWIAWVGDLEELAVWRSRFRFYYPPAARWAVFALAFPASVIVTWRCLVASLAAGLSGRKLWYHSVNLAMAILLIVLFVLIIRQSDHADQSLRFHHVWPVIAWLPVVLMIAAIARFSVAALAWSQAIHRGLVTHRAMARYVGCWLIATTILVALAFVVCRNTPWLRHLLMLAATLIVPLAGPAIAMHALAGNRSQP
jgi:hypothetical protein